MHLTYGRGGKRLLRHRFKKQPVFGQFGFKTIAKPGKRKRRRIAL